MKPGDHLPDLELMRNGKLWRVVDRELIERPIAETEDDAKKRSKAGLPAPMLSYVASRLVP